MNSMQHSQEYEKALQTAAKAHAGQKDWYGGDYVEHPIAVSELCRTERGKIAALLHDVVEDTDVTLNDLLVSGIGTDVVDAVDRLTKRKDEDIGDYHARISSDDIALEVKFADMRHNSDKNRFPLGEEEKAERTYRKYLERAERLFLLIGEERAKRVMTEDTYNYWLTGSKILGRNDT